MSDDARPDLDGLPNLTASADPALLVVTTTAEGERAGCLVGFHSQSSISAEHYCFWLSKANHTYRVSLNATHFAAHFLTDGDLALAEHFGTRSGESTDKFSGVDLDADEHGVPLLGACPNVLRLERIAVLDVGGDHVCVTAAVRSAEATGRFAPLRQSATAHLAPGHASEERAVHP